MKSNLVSAIQPRLGFRCPQCYTRTPVSRTLTTTARKTAIAAPEIDFSHQHRPPPNPGNARVIPASPSYFSGRPKFTDNFLQLQALLRRHEHLPTVTAAYAPRVAWRDHAQYCLLVGEPVPASKYHRVMGILKRLNRILPSMVPPELKRSMEIYKRDTDTWSHDRMRGEVDAFGRACGIGRRKSSTAKVFLVQGEGKVLVNGKSINSAFGRIHDRESALWGLKATGRMDRYNVWALASGGGSTGQAEAITLAVAKALLVHEPDLKPALRRAGCVTRNPKRVERKKPGRLKARKMPPWVKG
ncbi:37S ribosomal protein S9, mitochondrial [Sticta canariensis]|nr:37S ribosomal protein S9, mitochondrial [Sticta canariensis]